MPTNHLEQAHSAINRFMNETYDQDLPLTLAYIDPEQGRLVLGLSPDAPLEADVYRKRLAHLSGNLPLSLERFAAVRHVTNQDKFRPIIGGTQMEVTINLSPASGTVCVPCTLNGDKGFLVSGHVVVNKSNRTVYQPARSSDNNAGKVKAISDWRNGSCDAAWVEAKTGVDITRGRIWKSSTEYYTVTATKNASAMAINDQVYMMGMNSVNAVPGKIKALNATVRFSAGEFDPEQTLTKQILTDYASQPGDSGGPVFSDQGNNNVTFLGINVGVCTKSDVVSPTVQDGNYGIFSPWDEINAAIPNLNVIA